MPPARMRLSTADVCTRASLAANSTLKPPGHQQGAMDLGDLEQAWLAGFASDDPAKGGCPPCPNDGPCSELEPLATAAAPVRRAPRQYAF